MLSKGEKKGKINEERMTTIACSYALVFNVFFLSFFRRTRRRSKDLLFDVGVGDLYIYIYSCLCSKKEELISIKRKKSGHSRCRMRFDLVNNIEEKQTKRVSN